MTNAIKCRGNTDRAEDPDGKVDALLWLSKHNPFYHPWNQMNIKDPLRLNQGE